MDNLKNFTYEDIKDFYDKWYRPDLAAFVIVGDFDPAVIEAKLIKVMANVKVPAVKTKKPKVVVEGNVEPRFAVFTDPELTRTTIDLACRLAPQPEKFNNRTIALKTRLLNYMATEMIDERLDNIAMAAGSPFQSAYVYCDPHLEPFEIFGFSATAREGESLTAFEGVFTELLRAVRGGYALPELDRVKASMMASFEQSYNNRDDRKNSEFVRLCTASFYDNMPIPSAELNYELSKAIIEGVTIEELNAQIASLLTDENVVVYVKAQSKEGVVLPTEADLKAVYDRVKASTIEPYQEELVTRPLIGEDVVLSGSKVVSSEAGQFESTVWTLENGVKVVVKPTTYKADEVLFGADRLGGNSNIATLEALYSVGLMSSFGEFAGVSDFSAKELGRVLSGKSVTVHPFIAGESEGYRGHSSIKDLETMFQLTYLYATAPRFAAEDWGVMMDKLRTQVKGSAKDPMRIFQDSMAMTISGGNPRSLTLGDKMLSMVSMEKLEAEYKKIFSTTTDMTFFITGSVDLETLKPLVEKYIGSIAAPKTASKAAIGPYIREVPKGDIVNRYSVVQESPNVIAVVASTGDIVEYSADERMNLNVAGDVLSNVYLKTIREDAGGVYVVQNDMQVVKTPKPKFVNVCVFMTDTSKVEELLPLVQDGIDVLLSSGPSPENLTKAKEVFAKNFTDANNGNRAWLGYLRSWYLYDIDAYTNYLKTLDAVTVESVKDAAVRAFTQGNRITLVQLP